MTSEEVLFRTNDYIERLIDIIPKSEKQEKSKRENLDFALSIKSAIEKQIPKKITHEATLQRCATCPTCKNVLDEFIDFKGQRVRITVQHCKFCGQALEWGDDKC